MSWLWLVSTAARLPLAATSLCTRHHTFRLHAGPAFRVAHRVLPGVGAGRHVHHVLGWRHVHDAPALAGPESRARVLPAPQAARRQSQKIHTQRQLWQAQAQDLRGGGGGGGGGDAGLSGFPGGSGGGLNFRDWGRRGGACGFWTLLPTCGPHQVTTDGRFGGARPCRSCFAAPPAPETPLAPPEPMALPTSSDARVLILCRLRPALGHHVTTDASPDTSLTSPSHTLPSTPPAPAPCTGACRCAGGATKRRQVTMEGGTRACRPRESRPRASRGRDGPIAPQFPPRVLPLSVPVAGGGCAGGEEARAKARRRSRCLPRSLPSADHHVTTDGERCARAADLANLAPLSSAPCTLASVSPAPGPACRRLACGPRACGAATAGPVAALAAPASMLRSPTGNTSVHLPTQGRVRDHAHAAPSSLTDFGRVAEQRAVPSPTLSPTDPVPLGQLWPTGPIYSLYTAYIQPICSLYAAYIQPIYSLYTAYIQHCGARRRTRPRAEARGAGRQVQPRALSHPFFASISKVDTRAASLKLVGALIRIG